MIDRGEEPSNGTVPDSLQADAFLDNGGSSLNSKQGWKQAYERLWRIKYQLLEGRITFEEAIRQALKASV